MELEIVKERENPLFNRKELDVRIIHEGGTPKVSEVRDKLSALKSYKLDSFVVRSIQTGYGKDESVAKIYLYSDSKNMMKVEQQFILKRNGLIVEKEES
ncbi:MAG: 30S ribosomal protein S24e [Candidatus Methanofastidiosa archaeon]|jgi:ribosomal protein S24E|nr:30S ribosomal protein S24e [Candidatus Methanofastidiosa archaeon]